MSTIVSGIVTNGLVVPAVPLPEGVRVEIHITSDRSGTPSQAPTLSPSQLRKLPRSERQAILAASAQFAEEIYREDKDLTGFDAFSEEIDDDAE